MKPASPPSNILGRPLTPGERRRSQRHYWRFCLLNGASYMCLGENVLILFAANLGAPNAVVSLIGAMLYVGYAMLPLGVRGTARRGAARSLADFWVARNAAALFTASAALAAVFSAAASWGVLLAGSLLFYGCRAAGTVMGTPLVGDISSPEEAPETIGRAQAFFNASAVAALAAITAVTARWHGTAVLAGIIVLGSSLGVASSRFLRGIQETGAVREAASRPLLPGMREALKSRGMRRLAAAWSLLNLAAMMLIPLSMLALKRGCGLGDAGALVCACAQFGAGCLASFASGWLCRRIGSRGVLVAVALSFAAVPFAWLAIPGEGAWTLVAGCALFSWLGASSTLLLNATQSHFLAISPDKSEQVAGSVALNLATGAGAGILGSILGPWLVTLATHWAPALPQGTFGGPLGIFRLYFLLLVPLLAAAIHAALRLRLRFPEYVGRTLDGGPDFEVPPAQHPDTKAILRDYVRRFNAMDEELYANAIPNAGAEEWMMENVPLFECPDKDIERTYYFRWWTYRKHLRRGADGGWRVTEFLPRVPWSGTDNTIVCPAGHHFREGRWLRDPQYLAGNARFWLSSPDADHRWRYSSWLFTGVCQFAEAHGLDNLPVDLLDDAVRYYRRWEEGFDGISLWPAQNTGRMGGDGKGGFLSVDSREGTEISLGGSGWKPLMNAAMWSEAAAIAAVARRAGRDALADEFKAKAEGVRKALMGKCWNPATGFFSTRGYDGALNPVRELHGYAPWYFGVPVDVAPDWSQLSDPQGFAAKYGLTFPERRAHGFAIDRAGHECKWNGPSWPFATSIALTALANDLHAHPSDEGRRAFDFLMWQYAAQQKRTRDRDNGWNVQPWIDENCHPDQPEWLSRSIILANPEMRARFPEERGKDYNHSTFCDLVVSGLVGIVPDGARGFAVDPLCDPRWDYFTLSRLAYRGHNVAVSWRRGRSGLTVALDGREAAHSPDLARLYIPLDGTSGTNRIMVFPDSRAKACLKTSDAKVGQLFVAFRGSSR